MRGTTNTFALDDGTCGRNLQIGSDKTACHVPDPGLLLYGDGGLSKYNVSIDGQSIGEFHSDGFANVCIQVPNPLADGTHEVTGVQLAPLPGSGHPVVPFTFSVDTVPPPQPPKPVLETYSDSPPVGDNVTTYRQITFSGLAPDAHAVQLYHGVSLYGGAIVNADGSYTVSTISLPFGTYRFQAVGIDTAGNKSAPSDPCVVTVVSTGGTVTLPSAPTLTKVSTYNDLMWLAPQDDGGAPVTSYRVYRGVGPGNEEFLVETDTIDFFEANPPKNSYYRVSAVNSAGEGPLSNEL